MINRFALSAVVARLAALRAGATGLTVAGLPFRDFKQPIQVASSKPVQLAEPDDPDSVLLGRLGAFLSGNLGTDNHDPTTNATGFDFNNGAITGGMDYRINNGLVIGGAFSYTHFDADFEYEGEWLPERLQGVYLTGQIALGIGMYEWVVWCFQPLPNDPEPRQLAEAAWCATVHPAYMEFALFDRDEWRGPIRGPLWCAQTWLVLMARADSNSPEECESGLAYLYSLAEEHGHHVIPNQSGNQRIRSMLGCLLLKTVSCFALSAMNKCTKTGAIERER